MKSLRMLMLLLLAACCSVGIFTACSDDKDEPKVPEKEDPVVPTDTTAVDTTKADLSYTIMMYGCGGGNLDNEMEFNVMQVAGYGYSPKVNYVGLLKYSAHLQAEEGKQGTRRFTMTKEGMKNEKAFEADYRLDDPQHLADFIVQSQKDFPASHYILVLWNHGDVFSLADQPVADSYAAAPRDLVTDDVTGQSISIFEQEEAYRRAEQAGAKKLSVIYWDVCLMNMIEHIYQVKDHTDYVMGAAHLTPGLGGDYPELIHALETSATLEDALKAYVPKAVNQWKVTGNDVGDLAVTKTALLEPVVTAAKECSDRLCAIIKEPDTQTALSIWATAGSNDSNSDNHANYGNLYFFNEYESVDLVSTFIRLSGHSKDGFLSAAAAKLRIAMENAILVNDSHGLPSSLDQVSVGLTWQRANNFTAQSEEDLAVKKMSDLYQLTAFGKATGWGNFLQQNVYKNIGLRYKLAGTNVVQIYYDAANNPGWYCKFDFSDSDPDVLEAVGLNDFISFAVQQAGFMNACLTDADAKSYFESFIQPYLYLCLSDTFHSKMEEKEVERVPEFTFTFTYMNGEESSPQFTYVYDRAALVAYRASLGIVEPDDVEEEESGDQPEAGEEEEEETPETGEESGEGED